MNEEKEYCDICGHELKEGETVVTNYLEGRKYHFSCRGET